MHAVAHHHWHILGAGAIGSLVAYRLRQQNLPFTLISRSSHSASRYFSDLNGELHDLVSVKHEVIDNLIICTKSTVAVKAFESIRSRLNPQSIVICLFNGLGAQQMIQKSADCPVFYATTTEGVSKIAPNHFAHKGAGETLLDHQIMSYRERDELPRLFTLVPDIDERLVNKLVVNSLINPLTVLFDCKNGKLLSIKNAKLEMQFLANEISLWLSTYKRSTSAEEVLRMAVEVIQATANNTSSMRQDLKAKQACEIDFINGYWVQNNPKKIKLDSNLEVIKKIKIIESQFV